MTKKKEKTKIFYTHQDGDHTLPSNFDRHLFFVSHSHGKTVFADRSSRVFRFGAEVGKFTVLLASASQPKALPPAAGEALILLLCRKDRANAILGDFQERFEDDLASVGHRRARFRFWFRTLRSVGPLLLAKVRKWGSMAALVELGRRLIGS